MFITLVNSFINNMGYIHFLDETEEGKGSQDISSIVIRHLREKAFKYEKIILYSDACGGQNRNIKYRLRF